METNKVETNKVVETSEMRRVEQEIMGLRARLESMNNNATAVYDCIRNGEVPTKSVAPNQTARKSGDTRFEEMSLQLREDCRSLCDSIDKRFEEIKLLVR